MKTIRISDDSGFLGVIDPDRYVSFLSAHWDFFRLRAHILRQMLDRSILLFATGLEGDWRVSVRMGISNVDGFRQLIGAVNATSGRLCLVNYEMLSMAAQFHDVSIPEPFMQHCLIELPPGNYRCRIVQMFDPGDTDAAEESREFDFLMELEPSEPADSVWTEIGWWTA